MRRARRCARATRRRPTACRAPRTPRAAPEALRPASSPRGGPRRSPSVGRTAISHSAIRMPAALVDHGKAIAAATASQSAARANCARSNRPAIAGPFTVEVGCGRPLIGRSAPCGLPRSDYHPAAGSQTSRSVRTASNRHIKSSVRLAVDRLGQPGGERRVVPHDRQAHDLNGDIGHDAEIDVAGGDLGRRDALAGRTVKTRTAG